MNRFYCVQISKLTESKFISFCSCTTFVYCKTINVRMLLGFEPKAMTKLRTIFQLTKFFVKKIWIFVIFFNFRRFVPESECKVRHFLRTDQIFLQLFYAKKHKNFYFADIQAIANRPKAAGRFAAPNHVGRSRAARLPPRHRTPPRQTLRYAEAKATTRRSASASPHDHTTARRKPGRWVRFIWQGGVFFVFLHYF